MKTRNVTIILLLNPSIKEKDNNYTLKINYIMHRTIEKFKYKVVPNNLIKKTSHIEI